jgi:hypothetical protein
MGDLAAKDGGVITAPTANSTVLHCLQASSPTAPMRRYTVRRRLLKATLQNGLPSSENGLSASTQLH